LVEERWGDLRFVADGRDRPPLDEVAFGQPDLLLAGEVTALTFMMFDAEIVLQKACEAGPSSCLVSPRDCPGGGNEVGQTPLSAARPACNTSLIIKLPFQEEGSPIDSQ